MSKKCILELDSKHMDVEGDGVKSIELKEPKVPKASRYYYRHREDILARRRERLMADPEYVAKQKAREEAKEAKEAAKRAREEAKQKAREEAKKASEEKKKESQKERRARMAKLLGLESPG